MSHPCLLCKLDFTTCSNLRKHERSEKHLLKAQTVESKDDSLEVKELKEKLERAEYKLSVQEKLIESYQLMISRLPMQSFPESKESPAKETKLEASKKKVSKKLLEVEIPPPEPMTPIPKVIIEDVPVEIKVDTLTIKKVESIVIPETVESKLKKIRKSKSHEQLIQEKIEKLQRYWDELLTRENLPTCIEYIQEEPIKNKEVQKFRDDYVNKLIMKYQPYGIIEMPDLKQLRNKIRTEELDHELKE